jgi:transcriptional regulator with XRE-family HTH domain
MKDIQQYNKERLQAITSFLKWYRINSGLSQKELSEYSGVHRNTIIRYESDYPNNLTLLTVFEIVDALHLSPNEVFQEL